MKPGSHPLIGENILRFRNQQNITLNVLAERSGVSKAMLSQIESNKVNPTVATVWKIAQGLEVEINELLKGSPEPARIFTVSKSHDIVTLDTDEKGLHIRVLSPLSMAEDLEMYMLIFEPEGSLVSEPHFPKTEEYITVIEGSVLVKAGVNISDLHKGDFLRYHCDVAHSIENTGNTEAVVHMVVRFSKRHWE